MLMSLNAKYLILKQNSRFLDDYKKNIAHMNA